jgi:hypothetical protein
MSDKRGIGTLICDDVEMTTGNLDFFTPIIPENVLRNGSTIELNPVNAITDSGPYEFQISRDPDHYIYLPLTRLFGTVKVVKLDGSPLTADDNTSVCNLFPQSLFKQMEIDVEGTQLNDISSSTYAIKAFLETILTYSNDAKSTHLKMAGWSADTVGKENSTDAESWTKRSNLIMDKNYYFSMILHCDFFQMERFLIPNTSVTLKMIRNSDSYSFISPSLKAKILIKNLRLSVHKVKIAPDFDKAIESNLLKEPALYPLTQSKIKTFLMQSGTSTITVQHVLSGSLPHSLVVCFLDARSYNGDIAYNPFLFQHFNLNLLNVQVNSNPVHPRPFQPNYADGNFCREYRNLMDHGGCHHSNNVITITPEQFISNANFYIYDLSPDLCNAYHHHASKTGYMDIEVGWSTPLVNNIYMLLYSSHRQTIAIDHNRNVTLLE